MSQEELLNTPKHTQPNAPSASAPCKHTPACTRKQARPRTPPCMSLLFCTHRHAPLPPHPPQYKCTPTCPRTLCMSLFSPPHMLPSPPLSPVQVSCMRTPTCVSLLARDMRIVPYRGPVPLPGELVMLIYLSTLKLLIASLYVGSMEPAEPPDTWGFRPWGPGEAGTAIATPVTATTEPRD